MGLELIISAENSLNQSTEENIYIQGQLPLILELPACARNAHYSCPISIGSLVPYLSGPTLMVMLGNAPIYGWGPHDQP